MMKPDPTPLRPEIERLLRGQDRLAPPAGLKSRLLAAHDRGDVVPGPSLWTVLAGRVPARLIPIGAAAAAVLAVGLLAVHGGGRDGDHREAGRGHALASWRVVDDPSLGLGTGRDHATADASFASALYEGP